MLEARILGMRDIDAEFATVIVTRADETVDEAAELAGRRLALGSRDSGHAAILPLHYLAEQGLDAEADCELVRFDTDMGKHGDTGDSERRVVQAVAEGDADAGAIGDATWAALSRGGAAGDARARRLLAIADLLPLQLHRPAELRRGARHALATGAAGDELRRSRRCASR